MRVLFVCYENPSTGGSGVSMYCRDLLPALARRGLDVGVMYVQHRDWRLRPYVRTLTQDAVAHFVLVNSPIDPEESLLRPGQDTRHPAVEALVGSILQRFNPDVLHLQNLQGYPASMLPAARDLGIRTFVTFHDFWGICPRLGLARVDGSACDGPDGGLNCMRYCVRRRSWRRRLFRLGIRLPEGRMRHLFHRARSAFLQSTAEQGSLWTPAGTTAAIQDARLLAQHAERSAVFLRTLAEVDRLFAVSEFVKSVYVRHGLEPARMHVSPPALAITDRIPWQARPAPALPVRFGFLGRAVPMKGADVIAEAVRAIPQDRAKILLFGPATPETQRFLQGLSGDGRLEFMGPYTRGDLPRILEQVDVVVAPSVFQETVGLTVLEAQAAGVPVIASRIGALPEFVRDGESGLLFEPGNGRDLAAKMRRVIDDPPLAASLSARTRRPAPFAEHVDWLVDLYRSPPDGSPRG